MVLMIMNFVLIFIIMCLQLISISSEVNIKHKVRAALSEQKRDVEEPIRLNQFFDVNAYVSSECRDKCNGVGSEESAMYSFNCTEITDDLSSQTCENGQWILKPDEVDFGEKSGDNQCMNPSPTFGDNYECVPCFCVINGVSMDYRPRVVRTIDTLKRESDSMNNKVVTGIKFKLEGLTISLIIQQATLLNGGEVDDDKEWIGCNEFNKFVNFRRVTRQLNTDFTLFSYLERTMFLDEIILPVEYVVTGVRFIKIHSSEGHEGLKLRIKGTKYDSKFRLINGSDRWFDYENDLGLDDSYYRPRMEIPLSNCDDPIHATNITEIHDTNRLVRFRGTDMKKDWAKHVIPYFSSEPVECNNNRPLRGIGLSFKGQEGYGGYIFFKVFHHDSQMFYWVTNSSETHNKLQPLLMKTQEKKVGIKSSAFLNTPEILKVGPGLIIDKVLNTEMIESPGYCQPEPAYSPRILQGSKLKIKDRTYHTHSPSKHSRSFINPNSIDSESTVHTTTTERPLRTSPINSGNSYKKSDASVNAKTRNTGTKLQFQFIVVAITIFCWYI